MRYLLQLMLYMREEEAMDRKVIVVLCMKFLRVLPKWREDSKKVVILIGDAPTHDLSFAGYNSGADPGPDGIVGTSDDLVFSDVVQEVRNQDIIVLALQARN